MTKKQQSAFMSPVEVSEALAEIVGATPKPRTEITKKLWDYIKKHNLQDAKNRRMIKTDAKLSKVFGKKEGTLVNMFEMTKLVSAHIKSPQLARR